MSTGLSRRDFLRLGGLSVAGLAFRGFTPEAMGFEDADVVRVATTSWSVYAAPSFDSAITSTWYRDDLIHVYKSVTAPPATPVPGETPTPNPNPIWYRVWGGMPGEAGCSGSEPSSTNPFRTSLKPQFREAAGSWRR